MAPLLTAEDAEFAENFWRLSLRDLGRLHRDRDTVYDFFEDLLGLLGFFQG